MAMLMEVLDRIERDLPESLARLFEFLRIPSVSTDPNYGQSCQAAADWLAWTLRSVGFDANVRPTSGHPMVVGHAGERANRYVADHMPESSRVALSHALAALEASHE